MKPIRFGVMGCASVARRLVLPAMKSVPNVELVAVASRSLDKANSYASEFGCRAVVGYEELVQAEDVDAIYMPLPTGMHLEWAHRALDAGKHLLLEKSLASTLSEAKSIVGKAKEKGLFIKENYMFEYHSQQTEVRELVRQNIGRVQLFRASFGFPALPSENFRYIRELGGGALLDAGGYVLKALGVFFPNYSPKLLAATLTPGESGVDVAGAAMFELIGENDNIPAHVAFGFNHFYQCGIEVWGSGGKLTTDRTFTAGPDFVPSATIESASGTQHYALKSDNHFRKIIMRFAESVVCTGFSSDYDAILRQATLQDAVRNAAQTGVR